MTTRFRAGDWNETREKPKGRTEKASSLQLGGGSEKTYFAPNGTFRRVLVAKTKTAPARVTWFKLDPTFVDSQGRFFE